MNDEPKFYHITSTNTLEVALLEIDKVTHVERRESIQANHYTFIWCEVVAWGEPIAVIVPQDILVTGSWLKDYLWAQYTLRDKYKALVEEWEAEAGED